MSKAFGARLKQAREDAGLTQTQLANLLDHEWGTWINKYESGENEPSLDDLVRLARAVETDVRRLLWGYNAPSAWLEKIEAIEPDLDERARTAVLELARSQRIAARAERARRIQEARALLERLHTPPELTQRIVEGLARSGMGPDPEPDQEPDDEADPPSPRRDS